ncbi:MAG: DHH family phosphoesterase [Aeropyrum sp.]|nr:DHH family phosphoesterase [Aeropyrum sp.]MCE4616100.1 DHH family phosphoesterase [Aeropyrum sp.]
MNSATSFVKKLREIGESTRLKKAAVITHRNADPDAVGAALVSRELLLNLGYDSCLYSPEGVSKLSKEILSSAGLEFKPTCERHVRYGLALVVDAANEPQISEALDIFRGAEYRAIIDHHGEGSLYRACDALLADPNAGSSSELAVIAALETGAVIPPPVASAALAGIIFDTGRFLRASMYSFKAAYELLALGGDYRLVVELGRSRPRRDRGELSLRLARLKAFSRLSVGRVCTEVLLAVTRIGSYESHVARSLVDEGADVAVAISERAQEFRASVRVSKLALDYGITARTVASMIAERFGGQGGGHDEAGMAHLPYRAARGSEELAEAVFKLLHGRLGRMCSGRSAATVGVGEEGS